MNQLKKNLNKRLGTPYTENLKTLLREIRRDQNKWRYASFIIW